MPRFWAVAYIYPASGKPVPKWVIRTQSPQQLSERQVCFALRVSRNSFRYRSVAADDIALRLRIREITETRVHYGYRRVHVMLRREGWGDNHKRIITFGTRWLLTCSYSVQNHTRRVVWKNDVIIIFLATALCMR